MDGRTVHLVKPVTYVNRSGAALVPYLDVDRDFRIQHDLLVVADDVNLDVGRLRFRPEGRCRRAQGIRSR